MFYNTTTLAKGPTPCLEKPPCEVGLATCIKMNEPFNKERDRCVPSSFEDYEAWAGFRAYVGLGFREIFLAQRGVPEIRAPFLGVSTPTFWKLPCWGSGNAHLLVELPQTVDTPNGSHRACYTANQRQIPVAMYPYLGQERTLNVALGQGGAADTLQWTQIYIVAFLNSGCLCESYKGISGGLEKQHIGIL